MNTDIEFADPTTVGRLRARSVAHDAVIVLIPPGALIRQRQGMPVDVHEDGLSTFEFFPGHEEGTFEVKIEVALLAPVRRAVRNFETAVALEHPHLDPLERVKWMSRVLDLRRTGGA